MEKGQRVQVKIEDMTEAGQGVGRNNAFGELDNGGNRDGRESSKGPAVFVKGAVVGDVVTAELTKVKKNYAFGRLLTVDEPSAHRIEAFCPYFGQCGGCAYGELSYDAQLALKEKQVRDKLIRLGGVAGLEREPDADGTLSSDGAPGIDGKFDSDETPDQKETFAAVGAATAQAPRLRPIIGMEEPFRYRNKAAMPVWTGGVITHKGGIMENLGTPAIGFYRAKSHDVVDCYDCFLQSEPAMAAAEALRQFMISDNITAFDPQWEKGLLRHLVVKTARGTGEVMVILVINGKGIPNAEKLVEMLDDAILNLPPSEDGVEYNLESVILNVNKAEGKGGKGKKAQKGGKPAKGQEAGRGQRGGSIFGAECITLAGKPTILEKVAGLQFEISPLSFYQVNPSQTEVLYDKAIEYADLSGDETVLDLYCGVGTIGLFAAREMKRKQQERAALNGSADGSVSSDADGVVCLDSSVEADEKVSGSADFVENRQMTMNAGRVIGIESVKEAVLDANRNAVINGIVNARYVCGKAEEALPLMVRGCEADGLAGSDSLAGCGDLAGAGSESLVGEGSKAECEGLTGEGSEGLVGEGSKAGCESLAGEGSKAGCDSLTGCASSTGVETGKDCAGLSGAGSKAECGNLAAGAIAKPAVKIDDSLKIDHADVVFLDPPRAGCDERLLKAVVTAAPKRIVYVSCDPATLARDVKYLAGNGYAFVEATPVDMFPWTGSVETVALLSRKR